MSNNRVEVLESTVAELESTVEGLTEELVEAKERIRVLEAELDAETPTRVPERRSDGSEAVGDLVESAEIESADGPADDGGAEADDEATDDLDAAGEDTDAADEAEDSGTDDIIVA
ncbi:hypothetical protein OB905_12875 [Halobacteria archaeon AArc-dxtr1]|nr:hypothetical protein [Halobacteria archaeon AArc-dxtr1]